MIIMIITIVDNRDNHDKQDNHMSKHEIKPIFVRLRGAERQRIRILAVSQGLTMREAIVQAFEAWAAQHKSGQPIAGGKRSTSGSAERRTASAQAKGRPQQPASAGRQAARLAEVASALTGAALDPGLAALAADWPARAARLDWSKCPAAECIQTKSGNIWVASGTLVPLVHVFQAVAQDNALPEIAEVYGFGLEQLIALLRFAAEGPSASASGG